MQSAGEFKERGDENTNNSQMLSILQEGERRLAVIPPISELAVAQAPQEVALSSGPKEAAVERSTVPPSINSSPIDQTRALRQTARKFLGFAYNREEEGEARLGMRVLEEVPDAYIDTQHHNSLLKWAIDASAQQAMTQLKQSLGSKIGVTLEGVGISTEGEIGGTSITQSQSESIVCYMMRREEADCRLNTYPPLRDGIEASHAVAGDSFVRQGTVYTGYLFSIIIKVAKQGEVSQTKMKGQTEVSSVPVLTFKAVGERIESRLEGRQVLHIQVDARGFGGYRPHVTHVDSIEGAITEGERIEAEFNAQLGQLNDRDFFIDSNPAAGCLGKYEELKKPLIAPRPLVFIPVMGPLFYPEIKGERAKKTLTQLGQRVEKKLTPSEKNVLEGISVVAMLRIINNDFPGTLSSLKKHKDHRRPVLVIGKTRVGKSTIVGYLNEYPLGWTMNSTLGREVLDFTEPDQNCPVIGHQESQTKGCVLYSKKTQPFEYVDSAGFFDTAGAETEICNIMAISMMLKTISPTALIIVINSSVIFERNGGDLMELIEQLRKGIRDPLADNIWPSVIFLINDETRRRIRRAGGREIEITHTDVLNKIKETISILENERNKLIGDKEGLIHLLKDRGKIAYRWLKKKVGFDSEAQLLQEQIQEAMTALDPSIGRQIIDFQDRIEVLELLLSVPENIVLANVEDNGETRALINARLENPDRPPIPDNSFRVEYLGQEKARYPFSKFQTVMIAVASYLNQLAKDKGILKADIENLKKELAAKLKNIADLVTKLSSLDVINEESFNTVDQNTIEMNQASIKKYNEELDALREEKRKIEDSLRTLKEDESPCLLDSITPEKAIVPRSGWAYFNWSARRYPFKYKKDIPILRIEKKEPTRAKKNGGYFEQETRNLPGGEYEGSYLPGWYGDQEDCDAGIDVYVRKKDLPTTEQKIRSLEAQLDNKDTPAAGLNERIRNLEGKIKGLEAKNKSLNEAIQKRQGTIKQAMSARELYASTLDGLKEEATACRQQLEERQKSFEEISGELEDYDDFCKLLTEIMRKLKYYNASDRLVREIYNQFRDNVDPLEDDQEALETMSRGLGAAGAGQPDSDEDDAVYKTSMNAFLSHIRVPEREGWIFKNVPGEGNCFYHAVIHQLRLLAHSWLDETPVGTKDHDRLRLEIQGPQFKDGEWAGDAEIDRLIERFNVVVAILDTRDDGNQYQYRYKNEEGSIVTEIGKESLLPSDRPIIKLACTGTHYLSVLSDPIFKAEHTRKRAVLPLRAVLQASQEASVESKRSRSTSH